MRPALLFSLILVSVCSAAERHWQTGTWVDISVKRQMVDFGSGSSPFDRGRPNPSMNAMADVRVYVIETEAVRLEIKDVVRINKRSVDAVVGQPVTFALEKNTIYIRDEQGVEHKLRVTKKTDKKQS